MPLPGRVATGCPPWQTVSSFFLMKMELEFAGGLEEFAMEKLFSSSANTLVDAPVQ